MEAKVSNDFADFLLVRKKRARPETERDLKGNNEIDLKRKDKIGKRMQASKKRTRKARCNEQQ